MINTINFWIAITIVSINIITLYNLNKFAGKSLFKTLIYAIMFFVLGIVVERVISIFYGFGIVNLDLLRIISLLWIFGLLIIFWELLRYFKRS
jgi:hypothetical protein